MAKDKTLELSVQIAGKVDKSLMSAIGQAQRSVSGFSKSISKIGTAGLAAMGALGTASVAAIVDATNAAKGFEAQMGDVVKYVDGLADSMGKISDKIDTDTGRTFAKNYDMMKDAILDLSTQIPMTAEELTQLAAAAGQSGKAIDDLIQYDKNGNIQGFLKDVAMMGTAMDIDAQQAGDWAAKWEHAFNMNHDEVMVLADQINYLGANSATTAAEIATVVNEAASLGQIGGVDVATTAALADAMLAMGVDSGKAGTSVRRMITQMSLGASATKAQKEMWEELGFTATGVAKSMQEDSVETMKSVFTAIKQMPEERQVAALKTLFGQWSIEGAAKLVGNLDQFTTAMEMVSNPNLYKGSMEREFIIKADTAESIDKMLSNAWQATKIDFGKEFLPVKKQFSVLFIDILNGMRKNMPELKQLGTTLADIASKGVTKLGDALTKAMPYIQQGLDYVANNGDKVVKIIGGMVAAFAGMKAAPLIEMLLGGGGNLLFGSTGAFGKKSGGLLSGIGGMFTGGQKAGGLLASGIQAGISNNASGKGGLFGTLASGATGALATLQNWKGLNAASANRRNNTMSSMLSMLGEQGQNGGLGGMISGMFSNSKAGKAAGGIGKYFGNIGQAISGVGQTKIGGAIGGVGSAIGGGLKNLGGMAAGGIGNAVSAIAATRPGQAISGVIGGIGGAAGNALAGIQGIGGAIGGALSGPLSAIGSFGGSIMNVAGTALGPIAGMFGSILSGALPIVGVISGIIAVFSILYDNLDGVRNIIGEVFGEKGLAVFDSFKGGLDGVLGAISNILNGGLADALEPIKEKVVGFFNDMFGPDVANTVSQTFDSVVMIVQSVLGVVGQIVDFAVTYVKPIIEEVFSFLVNTVLPIILQTFNSAAPIISEIITNIGSAVMTVAEIIAQAIQYALPLIEGIISVIMTVGSVVIPALLAAFNVGWQAISGIIENVKGIFDGLVQFISGVFTGNWSQAWEGVKQIFGNAFEALVNLCKAPINAVIALINKAISGINGLGLTIPDWVPVVGGKSFSINIPTIPMLAKGGFTNGPSIAGEAGREAVISFDSGVRSQNINTWARAGELLGVDALELQQIDASGAMGDGGNMTFAPQITIQGNADDSTVDNLMAQMQSMFEEWYEQRQRQQFRTAY